MDVNQLAAESSEKTRYVFMTANLCNNAISEMYYLKPERYEPSQCSILHTYSFRFFMASLQYMFNSEYCKLFEKDSARKDQNVSSLLRLNNYHLEIFGDTFEQEYEQNTVEIMSIMDSDFCRLQRELRDSKFSHSDISEKNNFSIAPFSEEEFEIVFAQLRMVLSVINRLRSGFENEYYLSIPNIGTTTQNLVKQHSEHESYFYKHALGLGEVDL